MSLDPVTYEVVYAGVQAVAQEIKTAVMRTAYSAIVAVGGDMSAGIADPRGRLVAQGKDIPAQLGALPYSLDATLAKWRDKLNPGDVVISNDPYLGGSNHLNDVCLVMPAFSDDGELLGYIANRAHWMDIGGASAGSFNARVPDVYAEGLRIPPMLAYRGYEPVENVQELIFTNVRGAKERLWDLRAGLAGCIAGERGLARLCRRHGSEQLGAVMDHAIDYTERRLRARIAEIPDGEYEAEDWIEGDGWEDKPFRIHVTTRVRGNAIEIDWTGTDPQVRGGVNLGMPSTGGVSVYAVRAVLDPDVPANAGMWAPIDVIAPPGSLVNPVSPAASSAGVSETQQRLADLLMESLANVVPLKVIAGSHASAMVAVIHARAPLAWRRDALGREKSIVVDQAPGGMGARATKDGISGIKVHTGNTMTSPIEMIEFTSPVRVLRWERIPDTGGAGRQRGGCAAAKEYEFLEDDVNLTILAERGRIPPFGLQGGRAGASGQFVVNPGRDGEHSIASKNAPLRLGAGDRFLYQPAGSGGYGSPWERPSADVLADVLDGYVSRRGAAEDYGVVVNDDGGVDEEGTEQLRLAMAAEPRAGDVDRGTWTYGDLSFGSAPPEQT